MHGDWCDRASSSKLSLANEGLALWPQEVARLHSFALLARIS